MKILLRHALRVMGGVVRRRWLITTIVVLAACSFALAAAPAALALETGLDFGTATGLSTQDIRVTIAKIIRVAFGLLGVIAIGIVLTGGVMWMTSGGDEEKLTKAKKILTNGVIGLTIMLLSFAITQFVLSRLTAALGGGGVQIATEGGGGTLPPGALGGGCVDPGGTVPFVCNVSPLAGGVGSYVTVRGYRFGSLTPGTSKVQIGVAEASVVSCQGSPNWGENLIVVEVPQLDTGRSYPVTVTSPGGTSSNPRSLNVTADPLGPQIACIIPGDAPEGTGILISGKLFGATAGTVRFAGNVTATTSAWEDAGITSVVPVGAQSGEVTVTQGERTSNGYPFTVTCTIGSQCSVSNCCTQGQCVEAAACAPGGPPSTVGASCDGDAIAPACQPIACGGGLRCDLGSCTCQEGPMITAVSPQTLIATTDGTAYRRAEDVPEGTQTVTAPNGAAGNYLTIRGVGFGDAVCSNDAMKRCSRNADCRDGGTCVGLGRVVFMGGDGVADDQVAQLASCASAWTNTEVIAVVPAGAALGPIRIESVDPSFFDQTDDARGTAIEHFRLNTTVRPGLCAITPPSATIGAAVALAGAQFGGSRGAEDAALFGDQSATTTAWGANAINATVPAIVEGPIEVRIRNDGELSNGVTFTRAPEPREPRIQEIIPDRGGGGQYVTIRGQNFGVAIGKVTFTRLGKEYNVVPRFPDQCSTNWWKGNEITIRIPAATGEWVPRGQPPPSDSFSATGSYDVRVHARDGNALRASNAAPFEVNVDQPTPGICAIVPSSGPARAPRTSVQLIGERFGGAVGALRFFDTVAAAIGDRGADLAGDFAWADGLVKGVFVPATARTGLVRLWARADVTAPGGAPRDAAAEARGSNPVTFEVKDCRAGGAAACTAGQVCCSNGTCAARAQDCPATGPNRGSYQWTFATGVVPKMPRVVESCSAFSPSPWDSQGQGTEACVNANIRVQFTTSMAKKSTDTSRPALDAAAALAGMQVFRCGAGTNIAAAAGGTFEAAGALTGWRVVEGALDTPPDATPLESAHLRANRSEALPAGQAHGGSRVLLLDKLQPSAADNVPPNTEPRTIDLPRDAPVDRHYFAVQAPNPLITDTNGTTYTVRVFVRDPTPAQNPNRRAGIVVGRSGGDTPTDPGWFQQVANEVAIDGTWKELAASITFDSGPNAKQVVEGSERATPGFVRLYVTGPPADQPASADDTYAAQFDDLEVVRQGDPCAVREEVPGIAVEPVTGSGGRLAFENNVITVTPPDGRWQPGTWYEVLLYGDDTTIGSGDTAVVKRAFWSNGTPQLRLDGDKDGQEGGNYRFRFRTRDSADACAVQQVLVSPTDATATQPGPARGELTTTASLPGLVHLRADGIGDPAACFLLNTSGMPWSWATTPETNPPASLYASVDVAGGRWCAVPDDCGVISCATAADCPVGAACTSRRCAVDFCTDHRCTRMINDENAFANTRTVRALRETPVSAVGVPQPVTVQATVIAATPRVGESHVTVRFEKPRVVTVYPTAACQQACPNSRIIAVTNVNILPASLTPANVRLHECVQENCRRGELTSVDGVAATACASGNGTDGDCSRRIGTESQIILAIPDAYQNGQLKPNQSYRLILTGGATGVRSAWDVPLDQLNYADNDTGSLDAYSWTFRTRTEPCGVSRIELSPNPLVFQAVGQRVAISAVPFSAPDQCSPQGQPLDAETLPWAWDVANANGDVADFTTVVAAGTFAVPGPAQLTQTTRVAGPLCTLSCLRPGSRRVPGICGNGVVEVVAEECERQADGTFVSWCDAQTCLRRGASPAPNGTCGDGDVDAGEECDKVDATGASSATGTFPAWCDPGTCLRKGSGFGSVCGNGSPATQGNPNAPIEAAGDGEDCDDGNTVNGDGCSSRCLLEGTPRRYHATNAPNGILARCGDGVIADGMRDGGGGFDCDGTDARLCESGHEPNGGEECDPGAVSREAWDTQRCDYDRCVRLGARPITEAGGSCGNGLLNPDVGEQCDDGAVGSCSAASGARAGNPCATVADCGAGGACEDRQPVDGDGCSSFCLLEGASITWRNAVTGVPRPALCGDGIAFDGQSGRPFGGEACDAGSPAAPPDPVQIIQALGRAPANAAGVQETTAIANAGAPSPGQGTVRLICGHQSDAECDFQDADPSITPADYGIDRAGCCSLRPVISEKSPDNNDSGVCRNAQVTVRFNQLMDPGSVGVVTDVATGATSRRGAVLERQDGATWQEVAATPMLTVVLADNATVSELRFGLTQAMAPGATYRVRVFGANDDTVAQQRSIRSLDGVRFNGTDAWTFTTGSQVCLMSRVEVRPPSYLLQRRESRAPLEVTTFALAPSGEQLITEVSGYGWQYAWSSTAEDIATRVATPLPAGEDPQYPCGDSQRCAFKPAEPAKNGDAFGRATATITENIFAPTCTAATAAAVCGQGRACTGGHCTGETFTDTAQLRALICENPWPAVTPGAAGAATWTPYPGDAFATGYTGGFAGLRMYLENISIAYCRDQGERKVCRNDLLKPCVQNADCGTVEGAVCILDPSDDLPAFSNSIVSRVITTTANGTDQLRKEFLFLPRGAHYCSVSGERCDPTLAGICPPGEFCRAGQDAIGIRIYENEQHVGAPRWFQSQGFTEATAPLDVDGYRGVRAGRSTYLNIANAGSVFTNLFVLSLNDGAVGETKEILQQVLSGIRFSTDLATQNVRTCINGKRCAADGALCIADTHCPGVGNSCVSEQSFPCTADRDCRRVDSTAVIDGDTCTAPKDKLTRDIQRLEDLNEIRLAIEAYGQGRRRCSVTPKACDPAASVDSDAGCPATETCLTPSPDLAAGTFIPGTTTSRWPSWAAELGKAIGAALPVDPLNAFGGACIADATENTKYDQQTCWNQESGTYAVPPRSYLYEYARTPTGTWTVRGGFERITPNTTPNNLLPDLQPTVTGVQPLPVALDVRFGGVPSLSYTATGRCGDGALAPGEDCDPPGKTETPTACDPDGSGPALATSGFQFRTCQQNCTWSGMSACESQCGNFVWDSDTGEQCDVGSAGGRVPAGHPISGVVPGISTTEYWNTATAAWTPVIAQYACSATCTWTGGLCGDSIVQAGYGESCDLSANRAATPVESSAATQYGCAPSYAPNPCKGTGGFCGDGTIQDGMTMAGDVFTCDGSSSPCAPGHAPKPSVATGYEQCDGDQVRSCIFSAKCGGDGPSCATDADCAGQPPANRACVAQLALPVAGAMSVAYQSNTAIIFPFFLRSAGSIRVAVETSNDGVDLSNFTRDQIEAHLPSGQTINDFNPQGAQGGIGLYHRMRVRVCDETGAGCVEAAQPVWALAAVTSQVSTGVVSGIPSSGNRRLVIEWDNDWFGGTAATDSNLRIHRVTVSGTQTRSCGTPGTAAACKVLSSTTGGIANSSAQGVDVFPLGWSTCQAAGAQCGNGTVDAGEECDDGGKGRCANELTKVCASSSECTGGASCERDLDLCTSECKRNVCGDARQLAATCTAGHASKIGQPCTSNAQCGANGLCATEQCDLGTSNWRQGSQCTDQSPFACTACDPAGGLGQLCVGDPCTPGGTQCGGPAGVCGDPRCVNSTACDYGRTCNYCTIGSCSIATKQGGLCGDRVKNGPEACDVVDGTNQCEGLSGTARTQCEQAVSAALMPGGTCTSLSGTSLTQCQTAWSRQICNAACDAMCPPASTNANLRFTSGNPNAAKFNATDTKNLTVDACRLLDAFKYDVELGPGVDVWPAPMSIVIVTDLSGSMYDADIQCDSDTDLDTRIGCAKLSLRGDESQGIEGLLDRLARAREDSGDVRVALATFGEVAANIPAGFRDVKVDAQRQELKNAVQGYSANQGYTRTNLGLQQAVDLLNGDPSARTKVIIFLTDGQTTGLPSGQTFATAVRPIADAFKAGGTDRYIFTIAFSANPSQTVRDQMQQVASTPTDQFYFFGGDLAAFYEQIVGVIAGVSITILPTSGSSPSAVTYASRTQSGVRVAAGDEFAQTCAANGQPTTYRIRIDFRARSGSDPSSRYVWLRNPSALICTGPPWASGTGAGGGSGGGGASGGVGAPGTVESWTGSATCAATCASAGFPGCADVQFNTECPNGTLLQAWQDDNPDFDDLSSTGRDCSSSVEYRSVLTGPSRCFGQSGTDYQRFRCRCQ